MFRKRFSMLAAAGLTLGLLAVPAQAAAEEPVWPNPAQVTVDGQAVTFDAYTVYNGTGGTTYCKLRDVAMALSGSGAQFEVTWDGTHNRVCLTTGDCYTAVGGELGHHDSHHGSQHHSTGAHTSCGLYLDGQPVSVDAYLIGQNHYCKLRDLGTLLGFGVDWDQENQTIRITSALRTDEGDQVEEMFRLVNELRAEEGLAPLARLDGLDEAAQIRAAEGSAYFSHDRPDGRSCFTVLSECGLDRYYAAGENLARCSQDPNEAFRLWMNSDEHRENMLDPDYTHMGVGCCGSVWSQVFLRK